GDVREPGDTKLALADDELLVLIGGEELVSVLDGPGVHRACNLALRTIGVGGTQCGTHLLDADAELVEQVWIHFSAHRGFGAASDKYLTDAFHLRKFLRKDGIGSVIHLGQSDSVRGERQ